MRSFPLAVSVLIPGNFTFSGAVLLLMFHVRKRGLRGAGRLIAENFSFLFLANVAQHFPVEDLHFHSLVYFAVIEFIYSRGSRW